MKTSQKDNFLLVENDTKSLTDFTSELTRQHEDLKNNNVVVNLLNFGRVNTKNMLGFLEISNVHRSQNKSFVIINDAVSIDELPDELIVVPTLKEAEDMIQMDEIQRELGF